LLERIVACQNCSFENYRLAVIEKKIYSAWTTIATNEERLTTPFTFPQLPQSTSLIPHGCDDYIRDWNGCCQYGSIEAARARAWKERFMNIEINPPIGPRGYHCRSSVSRLSPRESYGGIVAQRPEERDSAYLNSQDCSGKCVADRFAVPSRLIPSFAFSNHLFAFRYYKSCG